jgi:hypothetical protein
MPPLEQGKTRRSEGAAEAEGNWAIRVRLQLEERLRELAMFNLAIDSKLRSCNLAKLRVRDVCNGGRVTPRAIVMQQKTQRPVQFEITEQTRESVAAFVSANASYGYWSRQPECAVGPRSRAFRAAHPACARCRMR